MTDDEPPPEPLPDPAASDLPLADEPSQASGTGHGHGKVILLGEHAVVYGHPALAGAIDRGVSVTAVASDKLRLYIPAWGIDVDIVDDTHPAARAVARIAVALEAGQPSLTITADAQLPAAAGLGSSAAMAVGVSRAMAAALGLATTDAAIAAAANAAETEFHHRPSGVDVALAMRGGVGVYRRDVGFVPFPSPAVTLAIGLSGEQRTTARMVEIVASTTRGAADDPRLVALADHAVAGAAELGRGDLTDLGVRMTAAHLILAELGVSTPKLDELVEIARERGALGAKLTGAGGGGAVIALAPGREVDITEAWAAAGYAGMIVTLR
jgi:mevalonate kinase